MNHSSYLLLTVMALSGLLQLIAAGLAIRLIRPSGVSTAWIFLACGFFFQGVRRLVALVEVVSGHAQTSMTVEVLGLAISLLMLCGILRFRPLFDDISNSHAALVKKQGELAKANHELEAFVSTVSHDLRTPLTTIIGYAEFLRQKPNANLDRQTRDGLAEIEAQGHRMADLMMDLLTLARVGYIERPATPLDSGLVVAEVLKTLNDRLVRQQAKISVGNLPALRIPDTLLTDVFRNLIGNALDYACPQGGAIEVWGERAGETVCFFVRDRGPGIPAAERERVFEMFYRGSTGKGSKGTGIGLALVSKVAGLYGGRAWVEETPGGGCTFCFAVKDDPLLPSSAFP